MKALVVVVAALGCIQPSPAPSNRAPQVQPEAHATPAPTPVHATAAHLGAPLTLASNTRLADLVATPTRFAGQTVLTEGTVSAVCQARGCWMQISDATQQVHVRMHGHSFFIPRDASGRHARVQATVIAADPSGHCEQEAAEATGHQVATLELDATGVELD